MISFSKFFVHIYLCSVEWQLFETLSFSVLYLPDWRIAPFMECDKIRFDLWNMCVLIVCKYTQQQYGKLLNTNFVNFWLGMIDLITITTISEWESIRYICKIQHFIAVYSCQTAFLKTLNLLFTKQRNQVNAYHWLIVFSAAVRLTELCIVGPIDLHHIT